jgi:hypothetical protein
MKMPKFDLILFLKSLILAFISFLSPIYGIIFLLSLAVMTDTIFAIYATIKLNGIKSFQSNKLFNLAIKTFFYMGSLLLAFTIDTFIVSSNTMFGIELLFSKVIAILWIYIEIKSIDETSIKLGNKPLLTIIKEMINVFKSLKKDIGNINL